MALLGATKPMAAKWDYRMGRGKDLKLGETRGKLEAGMKSQEKNGLQGRKDIPV